MRDKFPGTAYAQQAGLLVAKVNYEAGKADMAKSALTWVAEKSPDEGYQAIARLRLAGILVDSKAYDEALTLLAREYPGHFQALAADRRGDILALQGKPTEAKAASITGIQRPGGPHRIPAIDRGEAQRFGREPPTC